MKRPVKYSKAIAAEIIRRMGEGESLRSICRDPKMPKSTTVLAWCAEDVDGFRDRYSLAMDFRAQGIFDELMEIADTIEPGKRIKKNSKGTEITIGDDVERSKLRIHARMWVLSRMAPKRYGDKITQEISGPDGGPVRTEGEYRMTPDDEAAIQRIAAIRAKLAKQQEGGPKPNNQTGKDQ